MHKAINFLIITTNPNVYAAKQLENHIEKEGHLINICSPKSLEIDTLKSADIIINRNTGLNYSDNDLEFIEEVLRPDKQLLTNSLNCSRTLRDKLRQAEYLRSLIPNENLIATYSLLEYQKALIDSPEQKKWIIKTRRGQKAKGIHSSVDLEKDAKDLIAKGDHNYIIQPYFPLTREIRVLILKSLDSKHSKLIYLEKRPLDKKSPFYILNFENSSPSLIKDNQVPKVINELVSIIMKSQLDFHFITIDFLEDENAMIKLLEINSSPGFEGVSNLLQRQSKSTNIIETYLQYLKSDFNRLV
ncbi:hypothetical protein BALOs_1761 [Halobacteriovorax sp. BALOs_7]|uniref:hypothetical protein n=1 Tax=Halobacteriovorax sp. BALOs_7 TaxID=2109558 RepID=UPI000EA123C7|nr:hypothetical protein [Halobacteriovorax sp. BALOs_7]AYF44761.1 hypothetical protein BALOs_1761 [Halobacteriovorax sp. BALOs_7]